MRGSSDIREPSSSARKRAPRTVVPPQYVYEYKSSNSDVLDVIQSLVNGLDPKQVDPNFFSTIYPLLRTKQNELISSGNLLAARAVQNAMNHIARYYEKEQEKKEIERMKIARREEYEEQQRRQAEEARLRQVPQELLRESVELAINEQYKEIRPFTYKKLVPELRRLQMESIRNNDYSKAGVYDRAARKVSMLESDTRYEEITAANASNWEDRVEASRSELQAIKAKWKSKIEEAKQKRDREIAQMHEELAIEMQKFDDQFNQPVPAVYKKFSPKYHHIRNQERACIMTKRFLEAKVLNAEANEIQRVEEASFRKRYEDDLNMRRSDFMKKIEDRISARHSKTEAELYLLERNAKREILQAGLSLKRMEIHSDQAETLLSIVAEQTGSARVSCRGDRDIKSARSDRSVKKPRTAKSARSCQVRRVYGNSEEMKSPQELFRQRRAINNIIYSTCKRC